MSAAAAAAGKPSKSAPSGVSPSTASSAVDALLRWIGEQAKQKKSQLLDHDELIHVVVTMKKIPPSGRVNPYLIPIPHPLHTADSTSICLFVDDRSGSPVTPAAAVEKVRSDSVPVSDVIGLSQIKSDYVAYEARRKFCGSYDLFFADRRILPLLPRLIGKQFFKKKKHPLPIDLSHKNWKAQIERTCGSALLYVRTGTSCQINAGRLSMGKEKIVENVLAVVEGAVRLIPKMWKNVRSIHVKSEDSVGLPIYQALPEIRMKIDVGRKDEGEDGDEIGTGEVLQSGEEEVDKSLSKKVNNFRSRKGKKVHKIRYMDNDVDQVKLEADDLSEGVDEEEDKNVKKKKKKGNKEEEEDKSLSKKVNNFRSSKGKKVHKIRYMDNDVDQVKLEADDLSEGEDEEDKNVKKKKGNKEKKGKKLKNVAEANVGQDAGECSTISEEAAANVEAKKRKSRGKKSQGKDQLLSVKTKKTKIKH